LIIIIIFDFWIFNIIFTLTLEHFLIAWTFNLFSFLSNKRYYNIFLIIIIIFFIMAWKNFISFIVALFLFTFFILITKIMLICLLSEMINKILLHIRIIMRRLKRFYLTC
jgi:hypothetical protein